MTDVDKLVADGSFPGVILHEMGHGKILKYCTDGKVLLFCFFFS